MTTPAPGESQPRRMRWMGWVAAVFLVQAALIYWVSRSPDERPAADSQMPIKGGADQKWLNELAREDPELLTQPNPRGFSEAWLKVAPLEHQPLRWMPPDIELPYPSNLITQPLEAALASNAPPRAVAFVKPAPRLTQMAVAPLQMRQTNRLEIAGDLARRPLAKTVPLINSWKNPDLLKPSIVQVMVKADGVVFTGTLIGRSGLARADEFALDVALQKVRFQRLTNAPPSAAFTTGNLLFHWHVDPNSVTNLTVTPR
jgi:hypothetical protein